MDSIAEIHNKLTLNNRIENSKDLVLTFAKRLGWNPSYFIEPSINEKSNGYLVIEHGLQNSAIISFLKERNEELTVAEEEAFLSLSYNNLVNWHITIDSRYINYYYILNRENRKVETHKIEVGNEEEALKVSTFYEVIKKKPNSNVKALDDVLIENLSSWKRIFSSELNNEIDLISLSHLFNATIFLRSIEDSKKRTNEILSDQKLLINILNSGEAINISTLISSAEKSLDIIIPEHILSKEKLSKFNEIDLLEIKRYINSFYENDYNRFKYDFSIMTKQALSRIYQKYVSILSLDYCSNEPSLFPPIPVEQINKSYGAFYTPEYIARFFSKYICNQYTTKEFDQLKILEPSVGSGIFLRTLIETQLEQRIINKIDLNTDILFDNVSGIDIDPNACLATNLSLSLLHYIFNKKFSKPNIITGDSISILKKRIENNEKVDIVISNPPYINQDNKSKEATEILKSVLKGIINGKIDAYQAFLKLSIDILSPNGLGLFVLPQNFLIAKSTKKLRHYLLENCKIELVADLSAINVFENVGTYTALVIFRKLDINNSDNNYSWLLKCRTQVGDALTQLLQENETEQKEYQIYKAQNYFRSDEEWFLLNKSEYELLSKLKQNKKLESFLRVNQGIISGNDDIFIRNLNDVPRKERKIFKSFLPDKSITRYSLNSKIEKVIYYPYLNDNILSEDKLIEDFPKTYEYLHSQKTKLFEETSDVRNGKRNWWSLHRPRKSAYINAPKIVTPYISISPRFGLDKEGEFATSRSPYLILKDENTDSDLLYYFLGLLNSTPCYWALSLQAQKQSSGYNIFHLSLLKTTPIPDPTLSENSSLVSKMIMSSKRRFLEKNELKQYELDDEINRISCELFKLSSKEMKLLGL